MKDSMMGNIIFITIFGALIGWTIGITDAFLNTPFNPFLFLISW